MIETRQREKPVTLRDAQRALTRSRIRDAGRETFFLQGYERATIDEIAHAAIVSRSTLYAHFRVKEDILAEIVDSYMPALCAVAETLPGPVPSRAEIDRWLGELAAFIARERTPTVLIVGLASAEDAPPAIQKLGERLVAALAVHLPAFRNAMDDGPHRPRAWAWASMVIREVGWACQTHARAQGERAAEERLAVAGDLLERFVGERY